MHSNLQISLAQAHQQELRRQAAKANGAAIRKDGPGVVTSTARAAWLRTCSLATNLVRASAVASPAPER